MAAKTFETALIITGDGTGAAKAIRLTREQLEQLSRVGRETQTNVGQVAGSTQKVARGGTDAAKAIKQAREQFEGLSRALNETQARLAQVERDARVASGGLNHLSRESSTASSLYTTLKEALRDTVVYGGVAIAVGGIALAMRQVIEVGNKMQGLQASFTAVFGSLTSANGEIGYMKSLADDLGLNFINLSKDYSGWAAAVNGTALAGREQKAIFEAVAQSAKVLNLSADDTSGALRALSQMVSKGKVQAEELRGQLGERLPGAFQLAAKAMGKTTAQLNKMLELGQVTAEELLPKLAVELKKVYGGDALAAAKDNFSSNTNRMVNALTELAASVFTKAEPALSSLVKSVAFVAKHQDVLINALSGVVIVIGGHAVNALMSYVAASISAGLAARTRASTELAAAVDSAKSTAVMADARAIHTAVLLREAQAATAAATGMQRLRLVQTTLIPAQQAATAAAAESAYATTLLANAQNRAAAATGFLAAAGRVLSAALAMVGGPVGLLVIGIAGLVYWSKSLREEQAKTTDAVQTASGEWIKYTDIGEKAKSISMQYSVASSDKKKALEEELVALRKLTSEELNAAKTALLVADAKLQSIRLMNQQAAPAPEYDANGEYIGNDYAAGNDQAKKLLEQSYQHDVDVKREALNKLEKSLSEVSSEQKNLGRATEGAASTLSSATKESIKAIHGHGDAIKSLSESIAKQRIELEHGKLAAEYFTNRLNGLSDAEARAAANAGQYNAYLAERKKLDRERANMDGGILTDYRNQLEDAGLMISSVSGIDAVTAQTAKAVSLTEEYKKAIDSVGESATSMGERVASSMQTATSNGVKGFDAYIQAAAQAKGVSEAFLKAILQQETGFKVTDSARASAVSPVGALGVGQVMPATGAEMGYSRQDLFDPAKNIMASATYLRQMLDRFNGSERLAAAAYNAGPNRASLRRGEIPQITETQNYVRNVMQYTADYRSEMNDSVATIGNAAPAWQALGNEVKKSTDVVVEYRGEIDGAAISQEKLIALLSDKMGNEALKLVKSAEMQTAKIELSAEAYRRLELTQKEFNASQIDIILAAEQHAAFAAEQDNLQKERAAIRNGMAATYTEELKKQSITQQQINQLVAEKMQIATEKILHDNQQQTLELTLSAKQWREIGLAQEGYNHAQIKSILQSEKLLEQTKRIHDAAQSIGDSLLDAFTKAAMGGEDVFGGLMDTLKQSFSDLVLKPTISPITNAVSQGISSVLRGGGSVGNAVGGVTGALSNTWSTIKTGGWSGAAGAAGVAGTVAGMLGGNSTGASIGATIGNFIMPGIGSVVGGLLGGLFGGGKKKPKAEFAAGGMDTPWADGSLYAKSAFGIFGFTAANTKNLSSEVKGKLPELLSAMSALDNAMAKVMPAGEVARIANELAHFDRFTTDFEGLFKERLQIVASGLGGVFTSLVDWSGSSETITNRVTELINIQQAIQPALLQLNKGLAGSGVNILRFADAVTQAAGGVDALTGLMSTYYGSFYSETERQINAYNDGLKAANDFSATYGIKVDTKAALRAFVEGLDLTTAAGQAAFTAAMKLAPALIGMTEAQDALLKKTLELRTAIQEIAGGDLSILTPVEKLADARKAFEETYAKALAGNEDAISALASKGQALLQLSRAYNASGTAYTTDYDAVTKALEAIAAAIEAKIKAGTDGSHASGLAVVPFDGYRAELHKGEAVIDAATMSALRNYGIPVSAPAPLPVSSGGGGVDAIIIELRELRRENTAIKQELQAIKQDQRTIGQVSAQQRAESSQHAKATADEVRRQRIEARSNAKLGNIA